MGLLSKSSALCLVVFLVLPQSIVTTQVHSTLDTGIQTPLVGNQAISQEVGDSRTFWILDFESSLHYEIDASLIAIGNHCYIYMQDSVVAILGEIEATSRCEMYSDEFDTTIFPNVTDLTGDPDGRIGDIDGDPKIVILLSENLMSYYSQYNEFASTYSNLCEMIYIYYNNPTHIILQTIAHEFDHLIWFNYEMDEVHFVLEGIAEYSNYHAGQLAPYNNVSSRTPYFLQHPEDSLIYFNSASSGGMTIAIDYGCSYLFAFYLAEQFGVDLLRDLVMNYDDGAEGIESTLQDAGHNITFNDLYLDWITAVTIDELGFASDKYGFRNMDVNIQSYTVVEDLPFVSIDLSLRCYGAQIQKITSPPDNFVVEVELPEDGTVGVSIAFEDTSGWHVVQTMYDCPILVSGYEINIAYVITSYLFTDTPDGSIDFGVGSLQQIDLTFREAEDTTSTSITSASSSTMVTSSIITTSTQTTPCSSTTVISTTMTSTSTTSPLTGQPITLVTEVSLTLIAVLTVIFTFYYTKKRRMMA